MTDVALNGQTPPTPPILEEIGTAGTPIWAGRVADEFLPALMGDRARMVWREMADNSAIVGSFLYGIEQQLRAVSWEWEPAEGDKSSEYADWFQGAMDDMSMTWPDTISGALSHLPYGWSLCETVFKKRLGPDQKSGRRRSKFDDGKFGWRKIALRNQETRLHWEMDDEGGVQGMWQLAPPQYRTVFIPIERALLFRTTVARGSPESRSIMRNAYEAFYFAKRLQRIEAMGIERDLTGLPIIYVPNKWLNAKAGPDEKAAAANLLDFVTQVRRDEAEGAVIGTDYDEHGNQSVRFELVAAPGQRSLDVDAVIARYNQQMAMTVLADFILVGHEQVGSYNAAESKVDIFKLALQGRAEAMAQVISLHGASRLMGLNGWDKARTPRLRPGQVAKPDMAHLAPFLQALAGTGMQLWSEDPAEDALRRYVLESYGLPTDAPVTVKGDPIVVPRDPAAQPAQPAAGNPGGEHPAGGGKASPGEAAAAGASAGDADLSAGQASTDDDPAKAKT